MWVTDLEKKESGTQVSVCLEVLNLETNMNFLRFVTYEKHFISGSSAIVSDGFP